ncbi:MAG: hypothetical protein GF329_07645 [Candidatus Lokiarchaeota archaeon]|nr:hypothetical protein [Candidatus Lokiarchaeota archaeon]
MTLFKFRDRDAPISPEGIIFRVYGYNHPNNACLCDVEYAHSSIYKSNDPRAPRISKNGQIYFKFYADGGLNFVKEKCPKYLVEYKPLNSKMVGIKGNQLAELRKPDKKLQQIMKYDPPDELIELLLKIIEIIEDHSTLRYKNFGVFGSILHDFYHLKYSDVDLIIYGKKYLKKLREILQDFYSDSSFSIKNEFDGPPAEITPRHWYFKNYSIQEYLKYQREKLIYATIKSRIMSRTVKIEFEPVKSWRNISSRLDPNFEIENIGWTRATGIVLDDSDGFFIGGTYKVEIDKILSGPQVKDITQVVNYIEEYRGNLKTGEKFITEGNLEKVRTSNNEYYQITLTYGKNYDHQVLKRI